MPGIIPNEFVFHAVAATARMSVAWRDRVSHAVAAARPDASRGGGRVEREPVLNSLLSPLPLTCGGSLARRLCPMNDAAPARLTHLDEAGRARMVDVSAKDVTVRTATASGRVLLSAEAVAALRDGTVPKGDALAVARIAGITGAKRTPDLIPLCHPLAIHGVSVDLAVEDSGVAITASVRTADRTGVEMEALTSVSVAALTLVDMIKSVDKSAVITDVRLEAKDGGKSGSWRRS
jgi:cyclic pyranopterin monophosphate synthase